MPAQKNKKSMIWTLYPTTKLWLCLAITVLLFSANQLWLSILITIVTAVWMKKEKLSVQFKAFLAFAIIYSISLLIVHGALNPKNTTEAFRIPYIDLVFYTEGLETAKKYFNRIIPLTSTMFLLFSTLNMTDFGVALQKIGIPYGITYMFVSSFQMIPLLNRERKQIENAQRARGLKAEGSVWIKIKACIPLLMPVVANTISGVQTRAISLLTRGFKYPCAKTVYRDIKKTKLDKILIAICWLILLLCIAADVVRRFA